MKKIIILLSMFLIAGLDYGFSYDYSVNNKNYTKIISRIWKDGNYNGHYSGVPFLNKIGEDDILYYPYSWDYTRNNPSVVWDEALELHAYKNNSFLDLGNLKYIKDIYIGSRKPRTYTNLVGTTPTHAIYTEDLDNGYIRHESVYSVPIDGNNLNYGNNNNNLLQQRSKLVDLEKERAYTTCRLSDEYLNTRLSPYNFAVSQKVNDDGVTYNFAYISDDNTYNNYKEIIFYYKNSNTNRYRYMAVPFPDNVGSMFIDIGFIDEEDSPYNFYLIKSNYYNSSLLLLNFDFETEEYEIIEIPLNTILFKGLDFCFNGNKAIFDWKNKTLFYVAQTGNRFLRYSIYGIYIDLLNKTSSEPIIIQDLSRRNESTSAIQGIGITKQPYKNKLAIINFYKEQSSNHHYEYKLFQELGTLEYELNLPPEEEGIYMDSKEHVTIPGTDSMTPKVGSNYNFKVGVRTFIPQKLSLNKEYDRKSYEGYKSYNQLGDKPEELDPYVKQKLEEINNCFMNRYNTQLETINKAISKFEILINESNNDIMIKIYTSSLNKLQEIKEIFINTYSWY